MSRTFLNDKKNTQMSPSFLWRVYCTLQAITHTHTFATSAFLSRSPSLMRTEIPSSAGVTGTLPPGAASEWDPSHPADIHAFMSISWLWKKPAGQRFSRNDDRLRGPMLCGDYLGGVISTVKWVLYKKNCRSDLPVYLPPHADCPRAAFNDWLSPLKKKKKKNESIREVASENLFLFSTCTQTVTGWKARGRKFRARSSVADKVLE